MEESDLKELLDLTRENNKILRSMQRSARINKFLKIVYWTLILGSIFGTYYFIQPYIDQLLKVYQQATTTLGDIQSKTSQIPDLSKTPGALDILNQLDSAAKKQ